MSDDRVFWGFFIALIGIFVALISLAISHVMEERAACEKAGGYYLSFRGGSECVDPSIIIKVK